MWYSRVTVSLAAIPDFIAHYERELEEAKRECRIGGLVERNIKDLPGVTEHRFNQLQEIEAILNYLNIQLRKIRRRHFQKYLEAYARSLTSRDAEKYVDGEEEVVDFETIINEQIGDKKVILPLSGGLDSRTQAAALHYLKKNVQSYSYQFEDGLNETCFAQKIAKVCYFPFEKCIIPKAYL